MEQTELEQKVGELFERQGFNVEKDGNSFTAENGEKLKLKVFSSEQFSVEDIVEQVENGEKVFIDEDLDGVKNRVENDVSALSEEEDQPDFDTPSYEIIGDIAVINELADVEREEAVEGILHYNPNVKTILLKKEGLKGEFRIGDYEKLYGEETETVHKEHGCRYKVDPTKVYFSERFATERERVISQIEEGEKVLVMFAGVGPFAIMAAANANPEKVVAIEKNPEGANYLQKNIELNNVENIVGGIHGDVSEIVPELDQEFDRIIMPLPESSNEFLDLAFKLASSKGIIHYYRFLESGNWQRLLNEVNESNKTDKTYKIRDKVLCGQRAPDIERVCIDIEVL